MLEIVEKLESYCTHRKPATLTSGKPGTILNGRFRSCSLAAGFVAFELFDPPPDLQLSVSDPCTVVFADGARSTLFISSVVSYEPKARPLARLKLRIPSQSRPTEGRSFLRIPLDEKTAPLLKVRAAGREWRPRPIDFSLAGLLVEMHSSESFTEYDVEGVEIELTKNGETVLLDGFVQHRYGAFWVLYFSDVLRSLRHGTPKIPAALQSIFSAVELDWLDREQKY